MKEVRKLLSAFFLIAPAGLDTQIRSKEKPGLHEMPRRPGFLGTLPWVLVGLEIENHIQDLVKDVIAAV